MRLSPLEFKLFDEIKKNAELTSSQYALLVGSNAKTVRNTICKLKRKGALETIPVSNGLRSELKINNISVDFEGVIRECETAGIPASSVNHGWYKGKAWSLHFKGQEERDYFDVRDEIVADMQAFAPIYPVIKRTKQKENNLLIIDPADPHFGKRSTVEETGEETNLVTTAQRFSDGIEGLINKTDSYKFDKIVLVGGNDSLHTDNPFGTTTAGTKQDTAGMWYENFKTAKNANIAAIDRLLTVADVHFVFCPSNHDFMTGFFLADTLSAWYHNNKNVTFDISPAHRKYIQYGHSLWGLTHGDGAKENELSDLLKTEAKKAWALSRYTYWLVHHRHHSDTKAYKNGKGLKVEKDYKNITVFNTGFSLDPTDYCYVQYLRSLSGTDRWHFTNGFVHSPKAMEAFVVHPEFGQIDKITHLF
ncbi:MAG: hypothetical protein H7296_02730 [Bacteroidia bacterium]|nr:hypothetical protein [Bacteroidia bacterium]